MKQPRHTSTTRGFSRAASLLQTRVRKASEGRGFAQTRLLTHWADIVGQDIAATTQPVNISYGKGALGATLTLLTTGSMAPIIEMQKEQIREKVNACYGYSAISRVRITQTAPTGFADGRVAFDPAPKAKPQPSAAVVEQARIVAGDVKSDDLRHALEKLATHVLNKQNPERG